GVVRVGVPKGILGGDREGEAAPRGGGSAAAGQRQLAGRGRADAHVRRRGQVVGGVRDGQRLGAGPDQGHGEGALAVDQGSVGRENYAGGGIAAAEVYGAVVGGDRVALGILGGDRNGERVAGGGAGRGRQLEVVDGRWWRRRGRGGG